MFCEIEYCSSCSRESDASTPHCTLPDSRSCEWHHVSESLVQAAALPLGAANTRPRPSTPPSTRPPPRCCCSLPLPYPSPQLLQHCTPSRTSQFRLSTTYPTALPLCSSFCECPQACFGSLPTRACTSMRLSHPAQTWMAPFCMILLHWSCLSSGRIIHRPEMLPVRTCLWHSLGLSRACLYMLASDEVAPLGWGLAWGWHLTLKQFLIPTGTCATSSSRCTRTRTFLPRRRAGTAPPSP